jgi:hypothetical protein
MSNPTGLPQNAYIRDVPDTWEEHVSFHDYMKMYCGFTREESIAYAKKHLGPAPAKVVVYRTEITEERDEDNHD